MYVHIQIYLYAYIYSPKINAISINKDRLPCLQEERKESHYPFIRFRHIVTKCKSHSK